jgi:4-amino-4-deoxy-L-arabinose transferase-like glycosyltransferase
MSLVSRLRESLPGRRHQVVHSSSLATGVVVAVITLVNLAWALRDHTTPYWDQSNFLHLTWLYQQALDHHGPGALWDAMRTYEPGRGQFLSIALMPFFYVFGDGPRTGLLFNVVLWPVLLLSAGAVAVELFGTRARVPAILITSAVPELLYLGHTFTEDFLLATLSTLAVLLIIRSRHFTRRAPAVGLGLVIAAGTLTKLSFPVAIAGPFVITVIAVVADGRARLQGLTQRRRGDAWRTFRRPTSNLALAIVVPAVPCLYWTILNWSPTITYLQYTFSSAGDVSDPLSPLALGQFFDQFAVAFSWLFVLLLLVVAVLAVPRFVRWIRRRQETWSTLERAAFIASWIAAPIVAVAISTNHSSRYSVASMPALAITVAGLIAAVSWPVVRWIVMTAAVLMVVDQTLIVNVASFRTPLLPSNVGIHTRYGPVSLTFAGPDSPALPPMPGPDPAALVMKYLETESRGPDGKRRPASIVILQDQEDLNDHTLPYYAEIRNDPFTFTQLYTSGTALRKDLEAADFALYIAPPPLTRATQFGRVGEINEQAANYSMTPRLFALFRPHPERIFVGADAGLGAYVEILVRSR